MRRRNFRILLGSVAVLGAAAFCDLGCGQHAGSAEGLDERHVGVVSQALTDVHFGIHTMWDEWSPSYQEVPGHPGCGWKTTLGGTDPLHMNFANAMTKYASLDYYLLLNGKRLYWEAGGDTLTNGLDTVDLFFTFTHGQAGPRPAYEGDCGLYSDPADSTRHATWAMWDEWTHARSDYMRLGDGGRGLSVFASYSCDTQMWDVYTWTRWSQIFSGGLRMAVGFKASIGWCAPYSCPAQYQHTTNFANYLGAGWSINNAWLLAFDDNDGYTFNPISFASGNSDADCQYRRDNMTLVNFRNYVRRQGSQMTTLCARYWDHAD